MNRTVVNKWSKKYSNGNITPHDLRHFFCSHAIKEGFYVHEVAALAGHCNIHITLLYMNPSKKKMIAKMNLL